MNSDTPLTDAIVSPYIGHDYVSPEEAGKLLDHARVMERNINATNVILRRLVDKWITEGDELGNAGVKLCARELRHFLPR